MKHKLGSKRNSKPTPGQRDESRFSKKEAEDEIDRKDSLIPDKFGNIVDHRRVVAATVVPLRIGAYQHSIPASERRIRGGGGGDGPHSLIDLGVRGDDHVDEVETTGTGEGIEVRGQKGTGS